MRTCATILVTTLITCSTLFATAQADQPQQLENMEQPVSVYEESHPVVHQGDSVEIRRLHKITEETNDQGVLIRKYEYEANNCTVGGIQGKYIYFAAHCGNPGDSIVNRDTGEEIGIVLNGKHLNDSDYYTPVGDISYGKLHDNVASYNTTYTSQPIGDIQPLNKVCKYGSTTQKVLCGRVITTITDKKTGTVTLVMLNGTTNGGDSGGPVWDNDGKLVGVISGSSGIGKMSITYASALAQHTAPQQDQGTNTISVNKSNGVFHMKPMRESKLSNIKNIFK